MIDKMGKFCYLATDDDYIEVTQYGDGEDVYDIRTKEHTFSLSKGQMEAILFGIYQINYSS